MNKYLCEAVTATSKNDKKEVFTTSSMHRVAQNKPPAEA